MSEILYKKLLSEINGCADCTITNAQGVVIGKGIGISSNMTFVNMLDKDCIELQQFDTIEPLATITPDGKVLKAFKDILEDLDNVELLELTDKEIDLILEQLWSDYILSLESGAEVEEELKLFVSVKRDGVLPNIVSLARKYQHGWFYESEDIHAVFNKMLDYFVANYEV